MPLQGPGRLITACRQAAEGTQPYPGPLARFEAYEGPESTRKTVRKARSVEQDGRELCNPQGGEGEKFGRNKRACDRGRTCRGKPVAKPLAQLTPGRTMPQASRQQELGPKGQTGQLRCSMGAQRLPGTGKALAGMCESRAGALAGT